MIKEFQEYLNENITPFWEYHISYAREVIEQRDEDKELIIKFVNRYNQQFIPRNFQFKENIENCYVWNYNKKDSFDLKVTILNVAKTAVILKCEHNGNSKELEIIESPYMDIYQTVYHFLAEAVLNAEESEEETNMEI